MRNDDLHFAGVNGEANGAGPKAGSDGAVERSAQVGDQAFDGLAGEAQVKEDGASDVGQHSVERRLVGECERKQEFVFGHEAGFYSERRSNSTRARSQSAAICDFS